MQDLIKATKALSDETRLRTLNLVLTRECCVCEVMQALNISQTRASRHLKALHEAGFLKLRKNGLWSLYSIDEAGMKEYYPHLLRAVKNTLQNNATAAQDRARLRKAKRLGPGCIGQP
jgi:ArsR family transcriptional regulator